MSGGHQKIKNLVAFFITPGYTQLAVRSTQFGTFFKLLAVNCQLPIANCQLPTAFTILATYAYS